MRLSVIIPGYNTPDQYWRRSVGSVLAALGPDDEVICIDDGSSVFPCALNELKECDDRVKVIGLQENKGQAYARNKALEEARGEFIAFVDSDDMVCPNVYGKAFQVQSEYDSDIVVFGVRVVWCDDQMAKVDVLPKQDLRVLEPEDLWRLYKACLFEYPVNKIYRKTFLTAHGIIFERGVCPGEDTAFNLSCVLAKAKWSVCDSVGYVYYHVHNSSLGRYFNNLRYSLEYRTKLWKRYKEESPSARAIMGSHFEYTERDIIRSEWRNMWRRGSPLTLGERYRYIQSKASAFARPPIIEFIWRCLYGILRKCLYVRPVRVWNIKRRYAYAEKYQEERES